MTIYIASGDITDAIVMTLGTNTVSTTANQRDTSYTNCAMTFSSAAREGYIPFGTTTADFWVHMMLTWTSTSTGNGPTAMFMFDNGAFPEYRIYLTPITGNRGTLELQKTTDGSSWTTLVTWSILADSGGVSRHSFDIRIKAHASLGIITVCKDGQEVGSFAGDTSSQHNLVDRVSFSGSSANNVYVSEFVATSGDTPTVGWRVQSCLPNAAGTYTEFTGSYTAIDEVQGSSADFIISDTVGHRFLANVTDPTSGTLGSNEIKGVCVHSNGAVSSDSTPVDMQHMLRSNSGDYLTADLGHAMDGVARTKTTVYELNPATSAKFTLVEAAALQIGVKAV